MEFSDIIDSIDIVEYISQYVDMEEKNGEFWGLSPFNEEKTPSFSVNPDKKYWYDFSAGVGGNMVDFVKLFEGVEVPQAVKILKKYANINDDEQPDGGFIRLEATKIAKKYKNRVKPAKAIQTTSRLPDNYMNRFEFNKKKLKMWVDEGIDLEIMKRFGVMYDPFDDRIVYPIKDYGGNIISVSGRTCDPDYKAKGIRKYTYFQSINALDTLYGFSDTKDSIISKKEIILFEGAKSCYKAIGWGYDNVSALLTSHISDNQFRFLIRLASFYGVRIVIAVDSDVDVTKSDVVKKLLKYAEVEWVKNRNHLLEDKESPVDRGLDTWKTLYEQREHLR